VLTEYHRHYVNEDQTNWDEWVHFATYVYNTTVQSASGFTPFELLFGRHSTLTSALKSSLKLNIITIIVSELKSRLQTVYNHAHKHLIASKGKS
jgi:hypothetical protein